MNVQYPEVGLYWPIYLSEVNSSIQYSWLVRHTLQSRLSDDAGLEHPPPVGLDVFLAYLLRVYMETMVGMHQSQSQEAILWHPASQVRFDPVESTEGSLCIFTPSWQCAANAQELLDIWKLIFISILKASQKADRLTLCRSLLPVGNPLLQPCKHRGWSDCNC